MTSIPPWLEEEWKKLFARYKKGNLPHALLIDGVDGIGKSLFAEHAAQTFLCVNNAKGEPCGSCATCQLIQSGSHPDYLYLTPADDESVIKVDAIRSLINWLQLTPQYDSYKIAIIAPADSMNRSAANSLLKTLEEPASQDLIILTTDRTGSLPATVRSRCQRITLRVNEQQIALDWLQSEGVDDPESALALSGDGPLLAAKLKQGNWQEDRERLLKAWQGLLLGKASIARSVDAISDLPTSVCLTTFMGWVADISRLKVDQDAKIRNMDVRETLNSLINCLPSDKWFTLYDQLLTLSRTDSASFKTQTVLEGIFADIRLKQSV